MRNAHKEFILAAAGEDSKPHRQPESKHDEIQDLWPQKVHCVEITALLLTKFGCARFLVESFYHQAYIGKLRQIQVDV